MNKPAARQQKIFEWLEGEPLLSYNDTYAKYAEKYARSRKTFDKDWLIAKERHMGLVRAKREAYEDKAVQTHLDNTLEGLEARTERLFRLQREVQDIEYRLRVGQTTDIVMVDNGPKQFKRDLTIQERRLLWLSLRDLQREVSQMEGDYAPERHIFESVEGYVIELPANNR